jgi:succinylarginine dihydrolase
MATIEINFDGLIGPMHNYAGLSPGNIASASNAGAISRPREAALQGLAKMKRLLDRGLVQGFFPPLRRPGVAALRMLGFTGDDRQLLERAAAEDPVLFNNICSASAMWAANAATVIAGADSGDGRVHLIAANLASMLHRSFEAPETFAMLRRIFRDDRHFAVHPALPATQHFSDEGAANHMRLTTAHGRHQYLRPRRIARQPLSRAPDAPRGRGGRAAGGYGQAAHPPVPGRDRGRRIPQ